MAFEEPVIPKATGGHGGGDDRLRDLIFRPGTSVPDYLALPGSRAGAMSCLTGIAARQSVESGKPVKIADLATL